MILRREEDQIGTRNSTPVTIAVKAEPPKPAQIYFFFETIYHIPEYMPVTGIYASDKARS
jgi:hypothetical protein